MSKPLLKDLQELVNANIITQETAQKINAYYQAKKDNEPNKLAIVLGILGSVLVGLGIILVVAHNWDDLDRIVKTIFAFIPLAIGQGLCLYTLLRKKGSMVWQESCATILFFAVATAIALVSQIYHIGGELEDFLLTWLFLTFPLIYLLPSSIVSLLFIGISTWYGCIVGYSFFTYPPHSPYPWWYLVLILLTIPRYYYYLKIKPGSNFLILHNWFYALSFCIILGGFTPKFYSTFWCMEGYLALFGLYYVLGNTDQFREHKLFANPFLVIGFLGITGILMFYSGLWFWKYDIYEVSDFFRWPFAAIILLLLAGIGLLFYKNTRTPGRQIDLTGIIPFLFFIAILIDQKYYYASVFIVNCCVLGLGIYYVRKGSLQNHFGILNLGLLIIAVLALLRFFDDGIPFVWRGIFFLAAGVGFFAANYLLLKKRKAITNKTNP